jgi:hypothetical protein
MPNSKNTISSSEFEEIEERHTTEDDWSDIDDDSGKYKM